MDSLDWWHRLCTQECEREKPHNCFKILYRWLFLFYGKGIWCSEKLSEFSKWRSKWRRWVWNPRNIPFPRVPCRMLKGSVSWREDLEFPGEKKEWFEKGARRWMETVCRWSKRQWIPTPYPCPLFPMVDGLRSNLDLLVSLPCKYPLGVPSLPRKFCSEFYGCKFLELNDCFGGERSSQKGGWLSHVR